MQSFVRDGCVPRKRTFVMFFSRWPSDANLMMTHTFMYIRNIAMQPNRPKVLYIQSDNCPRENKNRWLLGLLGVIVKLGWFRYVPVIQYVYARLCAHDDTLMPSFAGKSTSISSVLGIRIFFATQILAGACVNMHVHSRAIASYYNS